MGQGIFDSVKIFCNQGIQHKTPGYIRRGNRPDIQAAQTGSPSECCIKNKQHDNGKPETGDRYSGYRQGSQSLVNETIPFGRRYDPEKDAEKGGKHYRKKGHLSRDSLLNIFIGKRLFYYKISMSNYIASFINFNLILTFN